jgi:hypothetical protein
MNMDFLFFFFFLSFFKTTRKFATLSIFIHQNTRDFCQEFSTHDLRDTIIGNLILA